VARAADFERPNAAASAAGLGDGGVHSDRRAVHAHRVGIAAGRPRADAEFGDANVKAGVTGSGRDCSGPICVDVWVELLSTAFRGGFWWSKGNSVAAEVHKRTTT